MASKFNVGDRVAVYDGKRRVGYVLSTDVDTRKYTGPIEVSNVRNGKGDEWAWTNYVHPKQCRRLKKKARRRVWLHPTKDGYNFPETVHFGLDVRHCGNCVEFIEVRRKGEG